MRCYLPPPSPTAGGAGAIRRIDLESPNEGVAVDEKLCVVASNMVTTCAGAGPKPDVAPSDVRVKLEPGMEEYHCETDNEDADAAENASGARKSKRPLC